MYLQLIGCKVLLKFFIKQGFYKTGRVAGEVLHLLFDKKPCQNSLKRRQFPF